MSFLAFEPAQGHLPVPAPTNWPTLFPADSPVLRNNLWDPIRSIPRGLWSIGVYSDAGTLRLLAMQDYVVDDFGALQELAPGAAVANAAWYASTYTIDPAACEWMDQFTAPEQVEPAPLPVVDVLPLGVKVQAPYFPFCAKSIVVEDDYDWRPGEPLYSVHAQRDADCLLLTTAQIKALAPALMAIALGNPTGQPQ